MQREDGPGHGILALRAFLIALFSGIMLAQPGPAMATDIYTEFSAFTEQANVLEAQAEAAGKVASTRPFAPPEGFALSGEFARRIAAFSERATNLSAHIDAMGGPKDLRCIYRGMSNDAKARLAALQHAKNAGEQAGILKDLSALFFDAREVTPQSKEAFADHHDGGAGQCEAGAPEAIKPLP
jgi:hypothetical protein